MIYHVYTAYSPSDPDTARRNELAQRTWKRQPWQELPIADADLPRMWQERGRTFPFIKDVFDVAVENLVDDDIVLYTNADIHVRGDCCAQVAEALQNVDAVYCYRRDWHHQLSGPVPDGDFAKGMDYPGSDLKAFRVGWWRAYRDEMPDMVLGAEAWDPVIRTLMDETNDKSPLVRLRDLICHERHGSYWENPAHRYKLKMQQHCLGLARVFFIRRGIDPRRFGIP